jgi:hypothetical protein
LDGGENKVIKFNAQNKGETAFGYYESGRGELTFPVQVDLTSNHKVAISDAGAEGIFFYDYFGNYLYTINHEKFKYPSGIAFDDRNRLYVSDPEQGSIFIFSAQGKFLHRIGFLGAVSLKNPIDLAVFNMGHEYNLYIVDGDYVIICSLTYDHPQE